MISAREKIEKSGDEGAIWARCLQAGDWEGAWSLSDRVLARRDRASCDNPSRPYHERWVWDGTPVEGRDVLVRCYHGLGDTLQFIRFLPMLRRHAAKVVLEVQEPLCGVLTGFPGIDKLVPFDVAAPLPPQTCTMEIMELAHVLRVDGHAIRGDVPYLTAATGARFALPPRAEGALALCWQAGDWDPCRSIELSALLDACEGLGRSLVSLQRGPCSAEANGDIFVNAGDNDMAVERTAALLAAASMVVTVDTMVAHLAGAMGKQCILLLKSGADWRWAMREADMSSRSLWYPETTILEQDHCLGWTPTLKKLRVHLGLAQKASLHTCSSS